MARRVTSPDFIGRRADLDRLEGVLAEARGGSAAHLLVGGEAGVGKSRFVREASRIATDAGMQVLIGRCLDIGDGGAPFAPFTDLLRGWVREVGRPAALATAGVHAPDLARLVPELRPAESAPVHERWAGARIHDALFEVTVRLAGRRPLVIVLEDLHWADADTLGTAGALIRAYHEEPVSMLITYRTDDLHRRHPLVPWLAEVTRAVRPVRVELAPFGADAVRALVAGVVGSEPPADLASSIHRRSDGNPFFAEELLVSGDAGADRPGLSASLRELLGARMGSVSDGSRRLLGVMAAVGRPVDDEVLLALLPTPAAELTAWLRELMEAALIVPVPGGDEVTFRHALMQEAAYEELLPGERRSLHRAIAVHLDAASAAGAVSVAEVARHWRGAREVTRALATSVQAGDEAARAFAFAQAGIEYDHALDAWSHVQDAEAVAGIDRIELLRRTARALHLAAEDRRAIELLREAVTLSRATADGLRTGTLLEHLGRVSWISGDTAAAIALTEEALMVMPADPPTAARARAVAGLGQLHMLTGRFESAVERCQDAIATARAVGAVEVEGHALNTLGCSLSNLGRSEAGIEALKRALAIGWELRNADDVGRAYVNIIDALWVGGRLPRALELVREGVEAAERLGVGSVYGFYIRMGGVSVAFDRGDWDAAWGFLRDGSGRLLETQGVERYRIGYSLLLHAASGHVDAPRLWARAAELIPIDPAFSTSGCPPQLGGIELACWEGRHREAIAIADDGQRRLEVAHSSPLLVRMARMGARAAADLVAVEGPSARAEAAEAVARFRARLQAVVGAMAEPGPELVAWMDLERRTLDADGMRADGHDDPATWEGLAAGWSAAGFLYEALTARARSAVAMLATGAGVAGQDAVRAAWLGATRQGARPMADWLGSVARRHGVRLDGRGAARDAGSARATPDRPYGLTVRELDVLRLVTDGRSNRQIADALGISENTAGVHVSNILGKLGVASRTEAARVGFGLGMVDPAGDAARG